PTEGNTASSTCAGSDGSACMGGTAGPPATSTDGLQNGDETGIDCGGQLTHAPPCAVGVGCAVDADCASGACDYQKRCALVPSCVVHFGGDTCGVGEVGDPDAQHESCCTTLDVPRPEAKGGPYKLDKYLVTAGRMRAFVEHFDG